MYMEGCISRYAYIHGCVCWRVYVRVGIYVYVCAICMYVNTRRYMYCMYVHGFVYVCVCIWLLMYVGMP